MHPHLKNVLALLAGLVVGSLVNIGLVVAGPHVIALPEGADISSSEGLAASMELFEARHFLFPWLAHALGTLAGAFTVAKLAASRPMTLALVVGGFFLLAGIAMANTSGGPAWFIAADITLAYLPMGYLGGLLAGGRRREPV